MSAALEKAKRKKKRNQTRNKELPAQNVKAKVKNTDIFMMEILFIIRLLINANCTQEELIINNLDKYGMITIIREEIKLEGN